MCVPLRIKSGRIIGALYVDHRGHADAFLEEDEEFLKAFGNLAAIAIENAELHEGLKQKALHLQQEAERRYAFDSLIGGSPEMQKVYALISNAAGHGMTVLLTGETGVGKELVARSIHYNGPRKDGPFIVQDCGAMPPGLLESELFGHRRGAFTGAIADRPRAVRSRYRRYALPGRNHERLSGGTIPAPARAPGGGGPPCWGDKGQKGGCAGDCRNQQGSGKRDP